MKNKSEYFKLPLKKCSLMMLFILACSAFFQHCASSMNFIGLHAAFPFADTLKGTEKM